MDQVESIPSASEGQPPAAGGFDVPTDPVPASQDIGRLCAGSGIDGATKSPVVAQQIPDGDPQLNIPADSRDDRQAPGITPTVKTEQVLPFRPDQPETVRVSDHGPDMCKTKTQDEMAKTLHVSKSRLRPVVVQSASSRFIRKIVKSKMWQGTALLALFFALFLGSIFTVADVPDDPGKIIVDIIMLVVMIFFMVEIVLTWLVEQDYHFSFFFWMDVVGTVSMVFEISWMLGESLDLDTVVLRTARTAKLGARVGRLFKLIKILLKKPEQEKTSKAKMLSRNLMFTLSTKVSSLTLALVMLLPLFSLPLYPILREDLSMKLWSQRLEESYNWELAAAPAKIFETSLQQLTSFYKEYNYFPYKVDGFSQSAVVGTISKTIKGSRSIAELLPGVEPNQKKNRVKMDVSDCRLDRPGCKGDEKAHIWFDFTDANRMEAGMGIALIVFMLFLMIFMAYDMHRTVENLLVAPLERMLGVVRVHAARVVEQFTMASETQEDEEEDGQGISEVEMLEAIVRKLARLAELHIKKNTIDQSDMKDMDRGSLAVMEMMEVTAAQETGVRKNTVELKVDKMMDSALSKDINSWDLDMLAQTEGKLLEVVTHIFWTSELGFAANFAERDIFVKFHEVVKGKYQDLPYHCYQHACDVLHCVFRTLTLVQSHQWMSTTEEYALLVAALCHDLGHFGKTNQYLVEVGDDLALQYNDKSPLENYHCASLFKICSDSATDVFSLGSATSRREARKVCISAILHTDNAHHFEMVQKISGVYEMNTEICEAQAAQDSLRPHYASEVLQKEKHTWIELFLHFADVSNPLKPFHICQAWAMRVLDEFFAQGDEEKRLGIPVNMLGDRDKVNRPGSQHGFINFLVAPLVLNTVRLFPGLQMLHWQMAMNLEEWRNIWVEDAKPPADEIAKKDVQVQKLKDIAEELNERRKED